MQKRVTFKKLQTCLKDELDQIIIDSSIGEIIVRDLKIDARRAQNSALRNLCLKPGDAIIQMLAFDMIERSRLIAQNNSNLVIKRGDIHILVARHLQPKAFAHAQFIELDPNRFYAN